MKYQTHKSQQLIYRENKAQTNVLGVCKAEKHQKNIKE